MDAQIAVLEHDFGPVQVIANETFTVPGSTQTYQLRSQDPHGPYGGPMLQLLSGRYPTGPNQIALTPGLASQLNLRVGDTWPARRQDRRRHRAEPPEPARRVRTRAARAGDPPDAGERAVRRLALGGKNLPTYVTTPGSANNNIVNPSTIILALATVGMLLIALVSIGGFTVLAQRRMRSLGMLESMGATDRNVRLVLEANGVIVGVVGALVGFALGLVLWLAYRPHNEQSAHHLIGTFALPWKVIVPAMVLAVIATFFAAGYPARAITRVPVVSALAGRPAPPRQIHRSLVPGVIALVVGFIMFSISGASGNGGGVIWLVPGLIALIVGIILVSPFFLALLARIGAKSPIAIRLPLRDMARYRARSGLGPLGHQPRHHDRGDRLRRGRRPLLQRVRLRRAEHGGEHAQRVQPAHRPHLRAERSNSRTRRRRRASRRRRPPCTPSPPPSARRDLVELDNPAGSVGLQNPSAGGRQWNGPIYVATPALLRAYGINPSSIPSNVDVLSSRPGLAGSGVQLTYGGGGKGGDGFQGLGAGGNSTNPCTPGQCLAHPVIQEESQLPIGHVGPQHGDHRERAAPAAPRGPEQPRRLDDPDQQPDHLGAAHERQLAGGVRRPEHRVEERRADVG